MQKIEFEAVKHSFQTSMTIDQLVEMERIARDLLAQRVSEALIAKRQSRIDACPHCASVKIVRNGKDAAGRQRFLCRKATAGQGCGRSFNAMTDTAFAGMRKPELWVEYAGHISQGTSLSKIITTGIDICRHTAFRWRHRLLSVLTVSKDKALGGIIEADETFFLKSFKGHRGWKKGKPPESRPPRYRGSGALAAGLSGQYVPVLTGIDRNNSHVDAVLVNRNSETMIASLGNAIQSDSILCADRYKGYVALANHVGAELHSFKPQKSDWVSKAVGEAPRKPGVLGLGRVNSHHEKMKTLINRQLRGVSTKFLPEYLTMLRLVRKPPSSSASLIETAMNYAPG